MLCLGLVPWFSTASCAPGVGKLTHKGHWKAVCALREFLRVSENSAKKRRKWDKPQTTGLQKWQTGTYLSAQAPSPIQLTWRVVGEWVLLALTPIQATIHCCSAANGLGRKGEAVRLCSPSASKLCRHFSCSFLSIAFFVKSLPVLVEISNEQTAESSDAL